MFCTNCGSAIEESALYCSQCGAATGNARPATPGVREPRLMRSLYDRKIAGVCAGLAAYVSVDPTLIRLIWLVCTVCFPPLLLGYFAAWIIMPQEPPRLASPFAADAPVA